jgi:hypothetical protein
MTHADGQAAGLSHFSKSRGFSMTGWCMWIFSMRDTVAICGDIKKALLSYRDIPNPDLCSQNP